MPGNFDATWSWKSWRLSRENNLPEKLGKKDKRERCSSEAEIPFLRMARESNLSRFNIDSRL